MLVPLSWTTLRLCGHHSVPTCHASTCVDARKCLDFFAAKVALHSRLRCLVTPSVVTTVTQALFAGYHLSRHDHLSDHPKRSYFDTMRTPICTCRFTVQITFKARTCGSLGDDPHVKNCQRPDATAHSDVIVGRDQAGATPSQIDLRVCSSGLTVSS
jgi:hypothetical protein